MSLPLLVDTLLYANTEGNGYMRVKLDLRKACSFWAPPACWLFFTLCPWGRTGQELIPSCPHKAGQRGDCMSAWFLVSAHRKAKPSSRLSLCFLGSPLPAQSPWEPTWRVDLHFYLLHSLMSSTSLGSLRIPPQARPWKQCNVEMVFGIAFHRG